MHCTTLCYKSFIFCSLFQLHSSNVQPSEVNDLQNTTYPDVCTLQIKQMCENNASRKVWKSIILDKGSCNLITDKKNLWDIKFLKPAVWMNTKMHKSKNG